MKNRRLWALALAVALLCAVCPVANAESSGGDIVITPFWDNTSKVYVDLAFSGVTANCTSEITGYSGTTKIVADFVLERKDSYGKYTTVKSWLNQTVSGTTLRFYDTYTVTSGYTYRLSVTAKVTRNGTTETVSGSTENKL